MKSKKVFLDELTSESKKFKVSVKVVEKRRPKESPVKVRYQSLLFEDDKGNKMRGALFDDQVEIYEDAIKHNGRYEISDANISPVKPEYQTHGAGLGYQMTFNNRTIIVPADDGACTDVNYCPINQLPRSPDYSEMFDIVGVVLFVEDQPRKVLTSKTRETSVREIVLVDHSTVQPLSVSVWDDLAHDDCTLLMPVRGKFRTVGLTALRVSMHRGFSMTTSASTVFIHKPVGEKADAITSWMNSHVTALSHLQTKLFNVKMHVLNDNPIKISTLRSKKAKTTLQDEKHWLEVTIPEIDFEKINAYMGCSKCWKRSTIPPGATYTCNNCSKPDCTSVPKVTFNCDISDGTGTLPLTMFTEIAEQLFRMTAPQIFHMKHASDAQTFTAIKELLSQTPFKAQVVPARTLSVNNILQWVVKRVIVNGDEDVSAKSDISRPRTGLNPESINPEGSHVLEDINGKHITFPNTIEHSDETSMPGINDVDSVNRNDSSTAPTGTNQVKDVPLSSSHSSIPKRKCRKDKSGSPSTVHAP